MTSLAIGIIEITATFLEVYIGFQFSLCFLAEKRSKTGVFLGAALLLTLVIQIMNEYSLFSVFTSVAAIVGWVAASILICRIDFWGTLISYILYIILIHVIDFLSISFWSLVFGNGQFGIQVVSDYSVYRLIHIVFCKIVLIAVWIFFFRKMAGRITLPVKKIAMASVVVIALLWYLGSVTFTTADTSLMVIWAILFLGLLTGVYLIRECGKWRESRARYELAIKKNEWIAKNYQQNQIFYHDLDNHYLVIKGFLQQKKYEQAEKYMEKLEVPGSLGREQWTGNGALDILLNYKLREGRENSIDMEIMPERIRLKLTDEELTILFGNALDNAIEACRKVDVRKRWIRIQMKQAGDMAFFKISNSISEDTSAGRDLLTAKEDKSRHGLGMVSMGIIVEKYGGVVESNLGEKEFVLSISFFE